MLGGRYVRPLAAFHVERDIVSIAGACVVELVSRMAIFGRCFADVSLLRGCNA